MSEREGKKDKLLIFLLRHGKPAFPDARSYIYGHTDYPLSDAGVAQAKKIGEAMAGICIERIISSDLTRAVQTADIVAGMQSAAPPFVEKRRDLREIDMGEWDGMTKDDIADEYVDLFRVRGGDLANVAAPGGETFVELRGRALSALEDIVETSAGLGKIMVVAHGGLFWSMVSGLFDIPLGDMLRFGLDYCALHLIEYTDSYKLVRYNWFPDLIGYMDFPI